MGERVTQANHRIEGPVNITVQKAPIGLGRPQQLVAVTGIAKGARQHVWTAVGADHIEPLLEESNRVKPCPRGDIEHRFRTVLPQDADIKITFSLGSGLPINQTVPTICKLLDVLLLIVIRLPNGFGDRTETLFILRP